ncbi:glycosyltransferase family 4 protein [Haladaptatus sp. CMAA 1911]|uniref:glycosyltransferase family 4 protein n=1 Tax=unclassified Haladaptatus TaxID=2622732 RepID=UPI003754E499
MQIAYVYDVVYPWVTGGAEKRIYELATRLARRGHDVHWYCVGWWLDKRNQRIVDHDGITLHAVCEPQELYVNGRRSIREALWFAARLFPALDGAEYDVVDCQCFPYFPCFPAKLRTLTARSNLVITWHEVWGNYWKEYLGYLAPFGKLTERATARTPHHPIAVSSNTADRLTAIGSARKTIKIVPNGINVEQIRSAVPPEEGYDILFAGRLIEHKNVDMLLEAFDSVADVHDVTLGIVGDGPEREHLEEKQKSLTHAANVEFLGFVDDYEDVLGHMLVADVFVSPSTREGFGITFAEAMAADCTVIAADYPDSAADEVIDGAGFLVKPTVISLTQSLNAALCGERPSTNPVKRAQQYDWDTVADQAQSAYQHAIDGSWC